MPDRSAKTVNTSQPLITTNTETVAAILQPISTGSPDELVNLSATATVSTGLGTTALVARIRRE